MTELQFAPESIMAIVLISIRVGMLFLISPVFSLFRVPVRFRIMIVIVTSVLLSLAVDAASVYEINGLLELCKAACNELLIGSLMAFGIIAAFSAFHLAGRLLDFQMGFGIASLIDPGTNEQYPLMGSLFNLLAVIVFFIVDGHHLILRGLHYSFSAVPVGMFPSGANIMQVVALFGRVFVFGLMIAAPVVTVLLLIDIALAVASRTMPQMNVFVVGFPIKIFMGLMVLMISIPFLSPLLMMVYRGIFVQWEQLGG